MRPSWRDVLALRGSLKRTYLLCTIQLCYSLSHVNLFRQACWPVDGRLLPMCRLMLEVPPMLHGGLPWTPSLVNPEALPSKKRPSYGRCCCCCTRATGQGSSIRLHVPASLEDAAGLTTSLSRRSQASPPARASAFAAYHTGKGKHMFPLSVGRERGSSW